MIPCWTIDGAHAKLPHLLLRKEMCMAKPRRRRKVGSKKRKARRDRRKR